MNNKTITIIILITAFFISCSKEDSSTNEENPVIEEKVYVGSLINPSSIELQEFYDNEFNVIMGDVRFEENSDISNLYAFSNVRKIEGSLFLKNNPNLESLKGLNKLEVINGDFYFHGLKYEELNNMNDFNKIKSIGGNLHIANAYQLQDLNNFSNLEFIGGDIFLFWIKYLTNYDFLSNITEVNGDLFIDWAANVENINGLSNISYISGDLYLGQFDMDGSFPSLTPLANLNSIEGDLTIHAIPDSYCGIHSLVSNNKIGGNIYFSELGDYTTSQYDYYFGDCGLSTGFNIVGIPNGILEGNSTRPSLYDGTIAWYDDTSNGDLFYWDGYNTNKVATGCFGAEISLYDGEIAFQHNEGANNGTRVYYWDGSSISNISQDKHAGWLSLNNGKIAFSGSINGNHELYFWDGVNTTQITNNNNNTCSPVPSLYGNDIAYLECGELYYKTDLETTLIYNNSHVDWKPSLFNGQIAFSATDGNDYEIFLWNGSSIVQITNDELDDKNPSLHDGKIAWSKGSGELSEIYYYDGTSTYRVTNNSFPDIYPSLYDGNIAWNGVQSSQGKSKIYYAINTL